MKDLPTERFPALVLIVTLTVLAACSRGGGGAPPDTSGPPPPVEAAREFRAIAGVSMGAYGAMNLGTKHVELFSTIASMGGPVDMRQLLRDSIDDNLEVKAQTGLPRQIGDDFTYDHLAPYPDRDTRVTMMQDLVISFGNPFLHHPEAAKSYLGSDSEPARLGKDDAFGDFTPAGDARGFLDGGDTNQDGVRQLDEAATLPTDVALLAVGSLPMIVSGASAVDVGGRSLADLDGDGVYDVGEGIVLNLSEPFVDPNGNRVFEPELGETYEDLGLDGVAGTGDFGEGNGVFDYDPDWAHWLAEDPLSRVQASSEADIRRQRIYMDVGTKDEFAFFRHYDNFVAVLEERGIEVAQQDGFAGNCADLPDPQAPYLLVRYDAGHVGVESVDPDDLLRGDVCGDSTIWQRVVNMIGFVNKSFPDGFFGPGDDFSPGSLDPRGDVVETEISSPALALEGGSPPQRRVLIYRPPAYFHTNKSFPIVYFLGGYGQQPSDFAQIRLLLDALILSGQMQNLYFAFVPGDGGRKGSFYVNHVVSEAQVPEAAAVTSGRYEDSLLEDLLPVIENDLLERRVRIDAP